MKKLITVAAALIVSISAFAQFQVGAGWLGSQWTHGNGSSSELYNGFYAGASYNIPIISDIGIAPGAYFGMTFFSNSLGKYNHMSVNIPVLVTYGMDLGPGRLFFGGGPTASIGIASNYTDPVLNSKTNRYEVNEDLSRFNLLMGIVGGYTISHIQFNFGYDWGVLDLDKSNAKLHQNLIHAGVAFVF
ncbi:MAG: outer membrane beta-barrel protein [Bacteroidales bacterium]|nr:outer membrane beta-barrel protein [Bacteroidales bacterium]